MDRLQDAESSPRASSRLYPGPASPVDLAFDGHYPRKRRACRSLPRHSLCYALLFLVFCAALLFYSSPSSPTDPPLPAASVVSSAPDSTLAEPEPGPKLESTPEIHLDTKPPPPTEPADPWDPRIFVNGPPTQSLKDNLRRDTKYLTSFLGGGWTNDFMTYMNIIYLGLLTERVPIIGPFMPTHIGSQEPSLPVSEIFDLPRLRAAIRSAVLEWKDVKQPSSTEVDVFGCWTAWAVVGDGTRMPRGNGGNDRLRIEPSYTAAPQDISLLPNPGDWYIKFWALAELAFPSGRALALNTNPPPPTFPSRYDNSTMPPDEHLLCFDFLYFAVAQRSSEWAMDFSPAWRFVGRHAHWTERIKDIAEGYVRRIMGIPEGGHIPPFISIHVRHNEFGGMCAPGVPPSECWAPLSAYARRVAEMREELLLTKGVAIEHVIMTSDEQDPAWWAEVRALGWLAPDHERERTAERYGKWYLPVLDAVIQSMGAGLVGTDHSTMSIVAGRRVESWNGGIYRLVRWGGPDADAH
ncbi:hypothetical protein BOTBODRAFT_38399 [Botryobasidium botryosum FD-172 SS1]|uniref:Uncharacterized protein n=1 Tax=Botryobasidium botryosum (strain FD-172 SS1) TaxID=930990 RepID=A0A067LZY1_BOTB1|nr:hypothetical protein BOTBODRAFT_38399 [Botryobasidium botryosum FD-172 SS1]